MTTTSRSSRTRTDPLCLAGFVLGLTGLVAWLLPLLGAVVAVTGLTLSLLGRERVRTGGAGGAAQTTVGLVLSLLALFLSAGHALLRVHLAGS